MGLCQVTVEPWLRSEEAGSRFERSAQRHPMVWGAIYSGGAVAASALIAIAVQKGWRCEPRVAWAVGAALACTGTVLCYGYTFSARTLGLRKAKAIFKAMLLIIVALGFVLLMFLDRMR